MGVGGQHPALAALPLGKRPDTRCSEGWVLIWPVMENLASSGIQFLDCPAHSESLYHLHSLSPQPRRYTNYAIHVYVLTVQRYRYTVASLIPSVHCC